MKNEKENMVENELINNLTATDGAENTPRQGSDLHLDADSGDTHSDEIFETERKPIDYSSFTKEDYVQLVKDLSKETDFKHVDDVLKEAKPLFDEIRSKEPSDALQRFVADGSKKEDFDYKQDEWDIAFDATVKLIKDKKYQHFKGIEDQKNDNFRKKTELLEKLRALVDSEDTEKGFHEFKELQKQWKHIGAVPVAHAKTLWANYNALIDLFYDHRSIYFELKELDRKKNLEAKQDLCTRAEALAKSENLKEAVRELNELHNEFKHLGPVPLEEKENVWQRFKAASDAIYEKRDAFVGQLQKDFQANLVIKEQIIEEIQKFADFTSDRIKEWNQKTQEILEVQKRWEAVGGTARNKSKDINKKFWSAFKGFFSNKNNFFKKLDGERERNLALKNEIVKKAQELRENHDWEKTANVMKDLQLQWKEVGPVPEKFREKVFQEFKEACDHFFNQRRTQFEKQDLEQEENLKLKESISAEIEKAAEEKTGSLEALHALTARFNEAGFVPKKSMASSKTRFQNAVDKYIASIQGATDDEKERASLEIQIGSLRDDPDADRKLYQKEQAIRKRIQKVENDIALWNNNLEFFGKSKNAEKVKEEFNAKIKEATDQLKQLKSQLKLLKTV
ncbi:MAG: DUF349 domain-containing protein [Azospira oryzae]|nr:MAG: DUF349 domain-containing protein [Azospira oryzae]